MSFTIVTYRYSTITKFLVQSCYFLIADVVKKNVENSEQYLDLCFGLFFLIAFANLLGSFSFFSLCSYYIFLGTLSCFIITFSVISGFLEKKHHVLIDFVPTQIPMVIKPIVWIIEFISFLTKPCTLSLRIFLNLSIGHLVMTTLSDIVGILGVAGWAMLPIIIVVNLLECMVGIIQAYLFVTFFSSLLGILVNKAH